MIDASDTGGTAEVADSLRLAMRGLAKSVTLISTADKSGRRHVMAATAVSSVSMAPPSMLFCINRDASSYLALLEGADFCINILAKDHLSLAHHCSMVAKGEARFEHGNWAHADSGIPYLAEAQASIFCTQDHRMPYGSHDVFFGLVNKVHFGHEIDPLVYAGGVYKGLEAQQLEI